jgi:hypothetical protein
MEAFPDGYRDQTIPGESAARHTDGGAKTEAAIPKPHAKARSVTTRASARPDATITPVEIRMGPPLVNATRQRRHPGAITSPSLDAAVKVIRHFVAKL